MKTIIISALALCISLAVQAQKVKGSDTVLPLSQAAAEQFMTKNPRTQLMVTGGGSGVGITALINGTTDIAQSSRELKDEERKKLKGVKEVLIAHDALAVVVNPANKVQRLTREQLEAIFTGRITNWKQVGGDNLPIVLYSRETSSGTYEFFREYVLLNKNYKSGILSMPATGAIIQSISQTKGAIGYVGLAYLNKRVRALQISYDKGKTYAAPSAQTAKNGTYPIVRPLYFLYTPAKAKIAQPFVNYVISAEGQKLVSKLGFIPR